MSFLAPFYALAGLAIAAPILFHLIRKQPKGNQVFSSLMFLDPSPPRLTRRSNIDQWLLLLLRIAALLFLAVAFSRPFWNAPIATDTEKPSNRRLILIDTSASMRRDGLWEDAILAARKQIQQSNPTDTIGVYAFDSEVRTLFSLEDSSEAVPSQRREQAEATLSGLAPSWNATDLGLALITASDALQGDENSESETVASSGEIIVVTDFQGGCNLRRLENYQWPVSCRVRVVKVEPKQGGNARWNLQAQAEDLVSDETSGQETRKMRVRIANEQNSKKERFRLEWFDRDGHPIQGSEHSIQVAAGSAIVTKIPAPTPSAVRLHLSGDDAEFDNDFYVTHRPAREASLWFIGDRKKPTAENAGFFLEQVPFSNPKRNVSFVWKDVAEILPPPNPIQVPLIAIDGGITNDHAKMLRDYMVGGGNALVVLDQPVADSIAADRLASILTTLTQLAPPNITEAKVGSYSMLERIDFQHPLFQALSDPRFNDFTKVRYWRHRSISWNESNRWSQLARFDDGSPAFAHAKIEAGSLWLMTAGWQPTESQLALSSKFVPILLGIFDQAAPMDSRQDRWLVGDRITLAADEKILFGETSLVDKESSVLLDKPGSYRLVRGDDARSIAVNLAPEESELAPADLEQLGRLGVNLAEVQSPTELAATQRQLRAVELEAQQGWWRYILIAVVGVVFLESLLAAMKATSWRAPSVATSES